MKNYIKVIVAGLLVMMSSITLADSNAAGGALIGGAIGGYAGNTIRYHGKPLKNGAAYGAVLGAMIGAASSPSDTQSTTVTVQEVPDNTRPTGQPPVGYAPPPPTVVYQTVPQRVVYVVNDDCCGYRSSVVNFQMQENAYWRGYNNGRFEATHPNWRDYGNGYRFRPHYHYHGYDD